MKAKYIIEAIQAMKAAESMTYSTPPEVMGKVQAELTMARCSLQAFSGLNDVEVSVEKENV